MLFELDLIAQRNPVGAHDGDFRLQVGAAAINGTAVDSSEAKAAALVKTQRIDIVVGGNDPKAGAPLSCRARNAWTAAWSAASRGRTFIAST